MQPPVNEHLVKDFPQNKIEKKKKKQEKNIYMYKIK